MNTRRQVLSAGTAFGVLAIAEWIFSERARAAEPEQDAEVERIARALNPRVKRGHEIDHSAEQQTIERLKLVRIKRGGLTLEERDELYQAASPLPQTEVEVNFAFDSSELLPDATLKLDKLGQVLARSNLQRNNIVISGHTDRKGSADYNLKLSDRRANAVADYLASKFPLDRSNLTSQGYGFEKLKNPSNPFAAENRRVEIVNGGHPG
jgi:outer membrane protein OmpA-like peptidoglycan-associated protein